MSERLNIAFCDDSTGEPYAVLALRDVTLETPAMAQWLTALTEMISEHAMNEVPSISSLAVEIIAVLGPEAASDLLPGDSPWLADLTVRVSCVGGEFQIACKKRDLSAFGELSAQEPREPLDALEGFKGSALEFQALVARVDWEEDPAKKETR
jgi:hypothetical protein